MLTKEGMTRCSVGWLSAWSLSIVVLISDRGFRISAIVSNCFSVGIFSTNLLSNTPSSRRAFKGFRILRMLSMHKHIEFQRVSAGWTILTKGTEKENESPQWQSYFWLLSHSVTLVTGLCLALLPLALTLVLVVNLSVRHIVHYRSCFAWTGANDKMNEIRAILKIMNESERYNEREKGHFHVNERDRTILRHRISIFLISICLSVYQNV